MRISVLSVNGTNLEPYDYRGKKGLTGFHKKPLSGPQFVSGTGLISDKQGDLVNHGGKLKAVYLYPSEHFLFWKKEFRLEVGIGSFGENLTTQGILESSARIGDILKLGSCELEIGQPRKPCFKLEMKLNRTGFIKPFLQSGRVGIYCRVLKEGDIRTGEAELLTEKPANPTIAEIVEWSLKGADEKKISKALELKSLSPEWINLLKSKLPK